MDLQLFVGFKKTNQYNIFRIQKKEYSRFRYEKQKILEDPLISHRTNSNDFSEYVEERDGKKREYAPKNMVATST
jgi:hypothetical protein